MHGVDQIVHRVVRVGAVEWYVAGAGVGAEALRHRTYGHVVGAAAGLDLVVVERAPVEPDGLHAAVEGDGQLEEVLAEQVIERPRRLRDLMGASQ